MLLFQFRPLPSHCHYLVRLSSGTDMSTKWGLLCPAAPCILLYERADLSYVFVCGDGEKQQPTHTPDECLK